jgi:isopenicillin N synthase-like dioxygenase
MRVPVNFADPPQFEPQVSEGEMRQGEASLSSALARSHEDLFFRFIRCARSITLMLLGRLSDELHLGDTAGPRLETYHGEDQPSLSTMSMFKYPKQDPASLAGLGHNKHTDLGTLTFLLTRQWGLQVLSSEAGGSWGFVAPRPGCAIINVGDSLRIASGNHLAAVVHRVLPLHGDRQLEDRYSIAYFLRMADDVELPVPLPVGGSVANGAITTTTPARDGDPAASPVAGKTSAGPGDLWNAKKWHDHKFDVFRAPLTTPDRLQDLTGGMERDDCLLSFKA